MEVSFLLNGLIWGSLGSLGFTPFANFDQYCQCLIYEFVIFFMDIVSAYERGLKSFKQETKNPRRFLSARVFENGFISLGGFALAPCTDANSTRCHHSQKRDRRRLRNVAGHDSSA